MVSIHLISIVIFSEWKVWNTNSILVRHHGVWVYEFHVILVHITLGRLLLKPVLSFIKPYWLRQHLFLILKTSVLRLRGRPWIVFSAIGVGMFLTMMDQSAINIALPEIASDFKAPLPDVQWMAVGYGLATGALILPMGKLSDAIGRAKTFLH